MKHRTRLVVLAASLLTLASVSRGEAASPCTDNCYVWLQHCMWTEPIEERGYCFERLDMCLANCGS